MPDTPERVALLLHEAARLCQFDARAGWPDSLYLPQCTALLAWSWQGEVFQTWKHRLGDAVGIGLLPATSQSVTHTTPARRVSGSAYLGIAAGTIRPVKVTEVQAWLIGRDALGAWLAAVGETSETLNVHTLAWLGSEWAASAQSRAGRKLPEETMQARREVALKEWLAAGGASYLENNKLTCTKVDAWKKLGETWGDLFRPCSVSNIEDFFKNQRLVKFKSGRRS